MERPPERGEVIGFGRPRQPNLTVPPPWPALPDLAGLELLEPGALARSSSAPGLLTVVKGPPPEPTGRPPTCSSPPAGPVRRPARRRRRPKTAGTHGNSPAARTSRSRPRCSGRAACGAGGTSSGGSRGGIGRPAAAEAAEAILGQVTASAGWLPAQIGHATSCAQGAHVAFAEFPEVMRRSLTVLLQHV